MCVSLDDYVEQLRHCHGAVTMAYPMGLPEFDPVAQCLGLLDPWTTTSKANIGASAGRLFVNIFELNIQKYDLNII